MEFIKPKQVTVFSKTPCPYCDLAKKVLSDMQLTPSLQIYETDKLNFTQNQIAELHQISNIKTFPKIFVGMTCVGGYTDMAELIKKGKFDHMLQAEGVNNKQIQNDKCSQRAPIFFKNILIGVSGSVAAIKLPKLLDILLSHQNNTAYFRMQFHIKVVFTKDGMHFFKTAITEDQMTDYNLRFNIKFYTDESEWRQWQHIGDSVLHIELRKWADVFVIAPLSANTLSKLCNGSCDNLLTSIFRAWDFNQKNESKQQSLIVAPAMNSCMLKNSITQKQLSILNNEYGIEVLQTVHKTLACGERGDGAMAEITTIYNSIIRKLC